MHADPLRVLRAVRFASRYSFTLVEEVRSSAASEEVCPQHIHATKQIIMYLYMHTARCTVSGNSV